MGMNIMVKLNGEVIWDKTVRPLEVAGYVGQIMEAHQNDNIELSISPEALPASDTDLKLAA
jgi:hypothetical protein